MSTSQLEELIQAGFTREEAMEALNLSNDNESNNILKNLSDYMKQVESDMLKLNEFSNEYNQKIESKLKSIHDESMYYQKLIQQKQKELTDKIENNRNILKSKLVQKKQQYINLTLKLQKIKQSLDATGNTQNDTDDDNDFVMNQNDMDNLSNIKQEIDEITSDNTHVLELFNNKNKLNINDNWYKIKDNIIGSNIIDDDDNDDNDKKNEEIEEKQESNILSIDLMTFNVRNSLLDKQWSRLWTENRRKLTADMLNKYGPPTIIASQEGVINQLIDIQHDLPCNYMNIGDGRLQIKWYNSNIDRMNEHCKIYWNNDILQVIDYGTFQLKRPKDAPLPRVVTWCLYDFDIKYNIKYGLLIINTHLSYKSEEIRIVQIKHLFEFVIEFMNNYKYLYSKQLFNKDLLIFICGDFNSINNKNASKLYSYLFNDEIDECIINGIKINDTFVDCTKFCNINCNFTFHAFDGMKCRNKQGFIDWIICSKNVIESDAIKLKQIEVITEHELNEGLPSDHYPVIVKLEIDTTKCQISEKKDCIIQ